MQKAVRRQEGPAAAASVLQYRRRYCASRAAIRVAGEPAPRSGKGKGRKGKADPSLLGFNVESSRILQGEIQYVEGM